MQLPKLSLLALLFAIVAVTNSSCSLSWGGYAGVTGSSLGWHYILDSKENQAAALTALQADFTNAQDNNKIDFLGCTTIEVKSFIVNSTGAVFELGYFCPVQHVPYICSKTNLDNLAAFVKSVTAKNPDFELIDFPAEFQFDTDLLYPGTLPTPSPPGVVNRTASNQTVMISGDYQQWTNLMSNKNLKPAIEHDLCSALVHYGVSVECTVDSMTPHLGDTTKMSPGDGNEGLTFQATITQEVTDASFVPYTTHGVCAMLMSVNYTETSVVYNKGSAAATETIKPVAAYADIPYSVLDCEYVCIVSISIMISAFYLFLCAFIIALIAVKCYLISDFSLKEITVRDMNSVFV